MSDNRKVFRIDPPRGVKPSGFTMVDIAVPAGEERRAVQAERERLEREGKLQPIVWEPEPQDD